MDRGAWWATGHVVAKSRTQLRDFTFTFFMKNTYIRTATPLHLHTLFLFLATLGLPCCTELSLVVTSRGHSPLRCASFSCGGFSFGGVWALGARTSAVVVHRLTCSVVRGIFSGQGLNPRLLNLLYWQMDYLPLRHLGSPAARHVVS